MAQKTLLRYPGGKSRAVKQIKSLVPSRITTLCSPFLGGASVEISLALQGVTVYGYDIFTPVVSFWKQVLSNPHELADEIYSFYPLNKDEFYNLQKVQLNEMPEMDQAAVFYVLNRSSFSGSTLSGGMSPNHPRFTLSSIDRVRNFKVPNLFVDKLDFHETLNKHKNDFLYLDPPYLISSYLYGRKGNAHKGFDHTGLHDALVKHDNGWILSYNDCPEIRELYKGYTIMTPEWSYGMGNDKKSKELLILNI